MARKHADLTPLIPELSEWNNGQGIDVRSWIECIGNYELGVGYSFLFWPSFVRFNGYVLREGFSEDSLRGFERRLGADRVSIEAVMNHFHLADIHCNVTPNEAQLRHLGRVLKDIHETKLKRDFPDLEFVVRFNDEPYDADVDYELTFWQRTSDP